PGLPCRQSRRSARGLPEREEGRCPVRRLHPDGSEVQRPEWRTVLQVQRSHLPHSSVREPGRGGPILERPLGGPRGRTVRLGEGLGRHDGQESKTSTIFGRYEISSNCDHTDIVMKLVNKSVLARRRYSLAPLWKKPKSEFRLTYGVPIPDHRSGGVTKNLEQGFRTYPLEKSPYRYKLEVV